MEEILYSIGLCMTSVTECPKRSIIRNPIAVLVANIIFLTKTIATIFTDDERLLLYLGDFGRYYSMKVMWNQICALTTCICISYQLNYYYGYRRGFRPTFLRVLQAISGHTSYAAARFV